MRNDYGNKFRKSFSKGTHVTKEGKVATKGLWYNIAQKKKRGGTKAKKGDKKAFIGFKSKFNKGGRASLSNGGLVNITKE